MAVISPKICLSQTDFFATFPDPATTLSASDKANFDKFAALPITENIQLVEMGNLRTLQSNGTLTFHLPGKTQEYQFRVSRAEYTDDLNYVWTGGRMIDDSMEVPDYALFVSEGSRIGGELVIDKRMYKIFPVNSQYQAFVKTKIPSGGHCQMPTETSQPESELPCFMNGDKCYTDVLIMYTPSAAALVPNISTIGKIAYEQFKTAFQRSKIKQQVRLVGVEQLISPAWVDDIALNEINAFQATLNTLGSYSNGRRAALHADLVILLTSGVNHTDVIGRVAEIRPTTADGGCGVVGINNAVDATYTFVHEVGHLFGGRHENDDIDWPARAHEFDVTYLGTTQHYLTMMISVDNPILNFSNPDVTYGNTALIFAGVPTGQVERNNACKIQNYGCGTSNLVASTACRIKATNFVCTNFTKVYLNLELKNDLGVDCPVNHWGYSYSTDGMNYTPEAAIIYPYFEVTYPPAATILFFRIKAYDAFGDVAATTFEWIDLSKLPTSEQFPCAYELHRPKPASMLDVMSLSPNPATDRLEVWFDAQETCQTGFEVLNLNGQSVMKWDNREALKGQNQFVFDISGLPSGIYVFSGKWNTFSNQLKFIKL